MSIDRKKQVDTTKKKHGDKFYHEIGSIGGLNSPTQFDSQSGSNAANIRWERYREEQRQKLRKEQQGNDTTQME